MIKRLILAAALSAGLSGAALAADNPDDCLKEAFDIAQSAEGKKLADADLDSLETMLSKMEAQCDAKEFDAASKTGEEIKAMLATK
ncbi:MAG: hypothetical protein KDJ37_05355 [Hyphomicrobiaceae bacterium]|nr:hypothetical protein [Hyphomicrobiaceae bacterium]